METPPRQSRGPGADMDTSLSSSAVMSATPTPTRDNGTLLREQQAERERLLMDNFNQALRINYLEERLLRVKQGTDFAGEDLESEIAQLRITLEERDHDLRQRNFAMIRATEAMDLLQEQLRQAREEAEQAREHAHQAQHDAQTQLQAQLEEAERRRGGADAEQAQKWRAELEASVEQERQSALHAQQLEAELSRAREHTATLEAQSEELRAARESEQRELQTRVQQETQNAQLERQKAQQAEMARAKAAMEAEHWREVSQQREDQLAATQRQMEALRAEKQSQEEQFRAKRKQLEEEVQSQLAKLQHESEQYRLEHTRLLTDAEKTRFERERMAMENANGKQERQRLQTEMERLSKELQELAGEAERSRLQNAKLSAVCEEQNQSLESFKTEREGALDTIHQLETELRQWRTANSEHEATIHQLEAELRQWRTTSSEHEATIRTLETRVKQAEDDARRMDELRAQAETRTTQTSNERLLALEKERQAIEQDNQRLREELSGFQRDMEAMEHKFQTYERQLENEAASAKEHRETLADYEDKLARRAAIAHENQEQLSKYEDELARRAGQVQELEQRLEAALTASSRSESEIQQYQTSSQQQFAMEKKELTQKLEEERCRASEMQRAAYELEKESTAARKELEALEHELRVLTQNRSRVASDERRYQPVLALLRDTISGLKSDFKAEVKNIQTQWKQQVTLMGSKLDRLSGQLHSSQGKLEVLQRSTFHAKDSKESMEKTWALRYEELRLERDHERRTLEEEIQYFQGKTAELEEALSQTKSDVDKLTQERKGSRDEWERDYEDLKESNRLLFEEVQERRRSAEHARKQHMRAVRENKQLLAAIEVYKNALTEREKDVEKYKAMVVKYTQQLQKRVSLGEVKQTLLGQLEETQYMINETYKRWSDSDIVKGSATGGGPSESYETAIIQLDEYIGRMQLVAERWGDFVTQSRELHRRYGDAWQSAATRGFDRSKEQPRWVDDVERKCSRLLTESVRVSEAMRDVVDNISRVLQRERDEKKRLEKERGLGDSSGHVNKAQQDASRAKWSPLDSEFFEHYGQPAFENPIKSRAGDANVLRLSSKEQSRSSPSSARRSVNALYRNSLSSLGRVGLKVQDIEQEIRKAHD